MTGAAWMLTLWGAALAVHVAKETARRHAVDRARRLAEEQDEVRITLEIRRMHAALKKYERGELTL